MYYFGMSDMGNVRENNEDSFAVKTISPSLTAAVVADGMGGYGGGEEASACAVDFIIKSIEDASKYFEKYTDKQIENFLKNSVIKLNKQLYIQSQTDPKLQGMGTTLVICLIYKEKYYAINVGDSRLYLYSDILKQITKDHSYVAELLELGVISEKEAKNHPNKNVITRAVGADSTVLPDFYKGKFEEGNIILICTDGLTNMVCDDDIQKIISQNTDIDKIISTLIENAKKNGGADNISAVGIKCDIGGESAQ